MRPAVFLDRDGVINDPVFDAQDGRLESPTDPAQVVLADGAVEGIRMLRDAGLLLVAVSNQPAAAKGKATLKDLQAVHERVVALLADAGVALDGWIYCYHHPDGVVDGLSGPCGCRKPAPGMLLEAAQRHGIDLAASWIVGDSDADIAAGRAAGCQAVLVLHPDSAHRRSGNTLPDAEVRNLQGAAAFILR